IDQVRSGALDRSAHVPEHPGLPTRGLLHRDNSSRYRGELRPRLDGPGRQEYKLDVDVRGSVPESGQRREFRPAEISARKHSDDAQLTHSAGLVHWRTTRG